MATPPGHVPLPPIGPYGPPHIPRGPIVPPSPDVLPRLRVPESGVPDEYELHADINDFAVYEPISPVIVTRNRHGFEHRAPNPDFDAEADEEYQETRSHLAGAVARYVTDTPDNFRQVVEDTTRDEQSLQKLPHDDPMRGRLERAIEVQARGLLPATVDSYPYDERFQITTEQQRKQVDTTIARVRAAAMTHELRGQEALLAALPVLQEAARNGMGPYIARTLGVSLETAHNAVEASRNQDATHHTAILNAQHKQAVAERNAEAAKAADAPAFESPNGIGRRIARAVSGETGQGAVTHRHKELDDDARKDHEKTHERKVNDIAFSAVQAARGTAIAVGKEAVHRRKQEWLTSGASALELLAHAMIVTEDEHGDPIDPHVVTRFKNDPPMGGNFVTWLRSAEPETVVPAIGPADRMEAVRQHIELDARREQADLRYLNDTPDSYERLCRLLARTEDLNDVVTRIDERLQTIEEAGEPSLAYQELNERRQAYAMLANQASYLYARAYSETNRVDAKGERAFDGRYGSVALIDGSYLMGDGDNARIYWPNGDIGQAPVRGEADATFPAVACNAQGEMHNYGNFVRLTPGGEPVPVGGNSFPYVPDRDALRMLAPILPGNIQGAIRSRLSHRHEEPVFEEAIPTAQRRSRERATVDPRDSAERNNAWYEYERAVSETALVDQMDPTLAESFKDAINKELGFSIAANHLINGNGPLREYLMRDRLIARLDTRITTEAARKKPDADLLTALRKEQAELNARTVAFGADPANRRYIANAADAAESLGQARYQAMRATRYDGTVRINQSGEVVFISGDHQQSNRLLREMLALPEGEWHFWPDGRSRHIVMVGKNRVTQDYEPTDFPAFIV